MVVGIPDSGCPKAEVDYRRRALKLFPWICAHCGREFTAANLHLLTVHHKDHDHDNNPADGSNWELLCIYCHDHEHSRFHEQKLYGSPDALREKEPVPASNKPFTHLKQLMTGDKPH